jgi:hypothetical protein
MIRQAALLAFATGFALTSVAACGGGSASHQNNANATTDPASSGGASTPATGSATTTAAASSTPPASPPPEPGAIPYTPTPSLDSAEQGAVHGRMNHVEVEMPRIEISRVGDSWSIKLAQLAPEGTTTDRTHGYNEVTIPLPQAPTQGGNMASTEAVRPTFAQYGDPEHQAVNWQNARAGFAVEFTSFRVRGRYNPRAAERRVGTASGRIIVLLHDSGLSSWPAPDAWLSGTFTDAPVIFMPQQ